MLSNDVAVSILLPIYREPLSWVQASVNSMLHQTFEDYELLSLVDNPEHKEVIEWLEYIAQNDERLVIVKNPKNLGLPLNLNQGITLAKGKYIARMDADDIAFPTRLEKQYRFMEANSNIDLCGCQVRKIDENNNVIGASKSATSAKAIQQIINYNNPLTHITWFGKKEVFLESGCYHPIPNAEDYDLLARIIKKGYKVVNLPEALIYMRVHLQGQTGGKSLEQKICFKYIQKKIADFQKNHTIWTYDDALLQGMLKKGRKYLNKQNKAQAYLLKSFQANAKKNNVKRIYFLWRSYWISPIQRAYYHDLLKSRMLTLWYD